MSNLGAKSSKDSSGGWGMGDFFPEKQVTEGLVDLASGEEYHPQLVLPGVTLH